MNNLATIEVSLTVIASIIAIILSAYSINVAKKRHENADLTELTKILTTHTTELRTLKKEVDAFKELRIDAKFTGIETKLEHILDLLKKEG